MKTLKFHENLEFSKKLLFYPEYINHLKIEVYRTTQLQQQPTARCEIESTNAAFFPLLTR